MKTPDHTPGHVSRAKDPAIVEESQNVFKAIRKIFVVLAIGLVVFTSIMGIKSCNARNAEEKAIKAAAAQKYAAEHPPAPVPTRVPTSGEGFATESSPLLVYMNPKKISTEGSGWARYTSEAHPSWTFDDHFDGRHDREWQKYPAGWYLVTPINGGEIYFRWWQ